MKSLKMYSNRPATREVIGCLMQKPSLIKEHNIVYEDFVEKIYQYVFLAIEHLYKDGVKTIDVETIVEYLEQFPTQYKNFMANNGPELLSGWQDLSLLENFEYNISQLKKFSLLRDCVKMGIDVSEYYDPEDYDVEVIEKKRHHLDDSSIDDILLNLKSRYNKISARYKSNNDTVCKKAGVGGVEQLEKWKQNTAWGLGYASAYLNAAVYGIRQRRYLIKSAGTGVGKTRTAIADICHAFAPKYYNKKEKKWCVNPNGIHNSCLYIGTEMELIDEIEPILWAYLADVPQDHIEFNLYEDDEEERVREAIRILEKESFIYLCYCPSYDIDTLTEIIEEHKLKYNITSVFFDYIQPTSELMAEYARTVKMHMTVREDQVLVNLSKKLKDICRTYNISFDTATQVSGDFKNIENRDVTIVRGAKSLVDKADIGMIAMPPTEKELKLVEGILQKRGKIGNAPLPNLIYSIYKNRGGRFNKCKIWLYIDYSTMRTHDMFVTDYSYKLWKDFPKVYINTSGADGKVAYDFGATIFAEDIDKVNEDIEQIKKDIDLQDYNIPEEQEEEETDTKYVRTEEDFDNWEI